MGLEAGEVSRRSRDLADDTRNEICFMIIMPSWEWIFPVARSSTTRTPCIIAVSCTALAASTHTGSSSLLVHSPSLLMCLVIRSSHHPAMPCMPSHVASPWPPHSLSMHAHTLSLNAATTPSHRRRARSPHRPPASRRIPTSSRSRPGRYCCQLALALAPVLVLVDTGRRNKGSYLPAIHARVVVAFMVLLRLAAEEVAVGGWAVGGLGLRGGCVRCWVGGGGHL